MADKALIDQWIDVNPSQMDCFKEKQAVNVESNVYKTQPKTSKSEDGFYRSKVKLVANPNGFAQSIVHSVRYSMQDENGFFQVISPLSVGDKNCPIFKAWKSLHFSGDAAKDEFAKQNWDKNESDWSIVQIIEDDNFPELVGKFKLMKLPKAIFEKAKAKMNPSAESKKPALKLNDLLFGNILEMEVKPGPKDPSQPMRETREVSYDLCEFSSDMHPIIKVDGTPLFDDDQVDTINEYADAYNLYCKEYASGKISKKGEEAKAKMTALREKMIEMYNIAVDYAKANCPDLVKECSYTPWSDSVKARVDAWIKLKLAQANGEAVSAPTAPAAQSQAPIQPAPEVGPSASTDTYEGLPF